MSCLIVASIAACGRPDRGTTTTAATPALPTATGASATDTATSEVALAAPTAQPSPTFSDRDRIATAQVLAATAAAPNGDPLAQIDDLPLWLRHDIQETRDVLNQPDLDPRLRQPYQEKLAALADRARLIRYIRAHPDQFPRPPVPTPVVVSEAARPRGILPQFNQPFQQYPGHFYSLWQDKVNGVWVKVYTGLNKPAPNDPTPRGFLLVMNNDGFDGTDSYPTPTNHGAITITAVLDLRFTLTAQDGATFLFDLSSREFVGPDGSLIPAAPTPAPLAQP